jgi:hypothetical protein
MPLPPLLTNDTAANRLHVPARQKYFIIAVFLLPVYFCNAQTIIREFRSTIPNANQTVYTLKNDGENNLLITGYISDINYSFFNSYLIKLDSNLNLQWSKGFDPGYDCYFTDVEATYDNGYLLTGVNSVPATYGNLYLVKTDSTGAVEWSNNYCGISGIRSCKTSDSCFLIMGMAARNVGSSGKSTPSILKIRQNGIPVWNYSYGIDSVNFGDSGYAIAETFDKGIIVAGSTTVDSVTGSGAVMVKIFVFKTDSTGNLIWSNVYYGGIPGLFCGGQPSNICLDSDSGFIISGCNSVNSGQNIPMVMKIDKNGGFIWGKQFDMCNIPYVASETLPFSNTMMSVYYDYSSLSTILLQTDMNGNAMNKKLLNIDFRGTINPNLLQLNNQELLVALTSTSQNNDQRITVFKSSIAPDGCGTISFDTCSTSFIPQVDIINYTRETLIGSDPLLTTSYARSFTDSLLCSDPLLTVDHVKSAAEEFEIYPNPATNFVNIKTENQTEKRITIYDSRGMRLREFSRTGNDVTIDVSGYRRNLFYHYR